MFNSIAAKEALAAVVLAAAVVYALFWPFINFFLIIMIPMILPSVVLFGGFAFGVGLTSDARRSGGRGRWLVAVVRGRPFFSWRTAA